MFCVGGSFRATILPFADESETLGMLPVHKTLLVLGCTRYDIHVARVATVACFHWERQFNLRI